MTGSELETMTTARRLSMALAVTSTIGFGVLYYAFSVVLRPMASDLGWSNGILSAGVSVGLVTAGLCAPFVGRWIDIRGGREVMALGSLVGGAGMLLWAIAAHLAVYMTAWAVIGVGMAMSLYEPAFAAIVRHAPARRRQGVLTITLAGALASTIFIPLTDVLVDAFGWRVALAVLGIGHIAVTFPLHLWAVPRRGAVIAPEPATLPSATPGGATAGVRGAIEAIPQRHGDQEGAPRTDVSRATPTLATSSELRRLVTATVLGNASIMGVGVHLVAFLIATGRGPSTAAALAGGLGVAKVVGRGVVGWANRYVGARALLIVCYALMGAALVLPLITSPGAADLVMVAAFGAGSGAITVVKPLYVAELFGTSSFGLILGRIGRISNLSIALTPVAIGGLVTLTGGYAVAWSLLAVGCLVATTLLPRTGPGRRVCH